MLKNEGRYSPAVVCDHCGSVITDAFSATAISSSAPDGATAQVFHVHKGACDDAVSVRLGGMHGSEELADHLVQLFKNTISGSDRERIENLLRWTYDE